jgi:hypothetical protein
LVLVLLPKLPQFHGVRLFGINKYWVQTQQQKRKLGLNNQVFFSSSSFFLLLFIIITIKQNRKREKQLKKIQLFRQLIHRFN